MSILTYDKNITVSARFIENDFRKLNPSEIVVLQTITMFMNESRKAFPSIDKICTLTNLSNKTVLSSIKGLCEKHYLSKELKKSMKNSYKFNEYTVLNNDLNLYVFSPSEDKSVEIDNRYSLLKDNALELDKTALNISINDFTKKNTKKKVKFLRLTTCSILYNRKSDIDFFSGCFDRNFYFENELFYLKQIGFLCKVKRAKAKRMTKLISFLKGKSKNKAFDIKPQNKPLENTLYSNEYLYEKIDMLCKQVENLCKTNKKESIKKTKDEYSVYFKPLLECYSNWYKKTFNSESDNVNHGKDSKHLKHLIQLMVGDFREAKSKREPETDFSKYFPQTKEIVCLFEKMLIHLQTSKDNWILRQVSITILSSRYSEIKTAMLLSKNTQQVENFSKEFEAFWNTYPFENRTEVKSDVYKVFKELSSENQLKAINGVKSYILDKEPKFIANPIKYLNAELWGTVKAKPKVNLNANECRKIMQKIYQSVYDGIRNENFKELLKEYVSPTETTNMNGGLIRIRDIKDNKVNFIFHDTIVPFLKESNTSLNTINTIVKIYDGNAVAVVAK